ncbi:hypothetical protein LCY76_19435 [Fictibacillus sp. KIGAM418]|uniref:Uncharacterized protein n=1 Tax=Fictibacillus marinisediminis TaxID=2878389 RepID=A0A9X2BEA1_9BACL|nr:hypothetical protein [Fictibacillus marinisediminis]MCK6258744.1 hypothetical protein [Fictibacillus marinisediminis]
MKKLVAAVILLLESLVYVLAPLTQKTLYLDRFSVNANNPVSFHWNTIAINTGFVKGDPGSVYHRCTSGARHRFYTSVKSRCLAPSN